MTRVIKNEAQHNEALAALETLIDADPEAGSAQAEELELLSVLIEAYENERCPIPDPTPTEAIRFRMDQMGLLQRDLVPYFGSRAKVSEVLSGKRQLSLAMIRNLHEGLGIPAEVLIQTDRGSETSSQPTSQDEPDWARYPLKEMVERGWIATSLDQARAHPRECVLSLSVGLPAGLDAPLFLRTGLHIRRADNTHVYALHAWAARVLQRAGEPPRDFPASPKVTPEFMRSIVRMSRLDEGPRLALDLLRQNGIRVVIERHLQKTRLDGAAFALESPVIGLTLRYDRIDNYWFCLMHELAHLALADQRTGDSFLDNDLERRDALSDVEKRADKLAAETLIPSDFWAKNRGGQAATSDEIRTLAAALGIHPAIVAGRIRHDTGDYTRFSKLVGHRKVRRLLESAA